jgi:glycosyltransferase involved in cell wall biosynthesis
MGVPVIATAYSGNMDFMDESNGYLVKYKMTKLESVSGPYSAGFQCAEPDIRQAAEYMKHVYENPSEAKAKGETACAHVRSKYSHKEVAKVFSDRLHQISRHQRRGQHSV